MHPGFGPGPPPPSHSADGSQAHDQGPAPANPHPAGTPLSKTRSLSDGGGSQLSPSPFIVEAARRASKDDSSLMTDSPTLDTHPASVGAAAKDRDHEFVTPVTPRRPDFAFARNPGLNLSLQMPQHDSGAAGPSGDPGMGIGGANSSGSDNANPGAGSRTSNPQARMTTPTALSPMPDHSQLYPSPTNILPRRSRGLDFSRAATSLHHSTLAEQSSPDSSPTITGGRAMSIPRRHPDGPADLGAEHTSNSLWSMMGAQERMNIASSVGTSTHVGSTVGSDSSSSDDDDDFMDDDVMMLDDAIMSTPSASRHTHPPGGDVTPVQTTTNNVMPWMPDASSPAISSLASFRTRPRKQPRRKTRGAAGLPFNAAAPAAFSKSPPSNNAREKREAHPRRESISWAANQLQISGSGDDEANRSMDMLEPGKDGQRGVVKRVVTRRGNLFPKTKGFARIRAALLEEGAPVDSEVKREAEVIRQVRDSDVDLEPRVPPGGQLPHLDIPNKHSGEKITADSLVTPGGPPSPSPNNNAGGMAEPPSSAMDEEDLMTDGSNGGFKQQALQNSRGKGRNFWDAFSETSSINGTTSGAGGGRATTPPPPLQQQQPLPGLPRGSSSGVSNDDVNMDSPSVSTASGYTSSIFGPGATLTLGPGGSNSGNGSDGNGSGKTGSMIPPTAAEITRRINTKRRREDDFDPHIFKRRAVSPGMSVHNSPVLQSPLQRDSAPWGPSTATANATSNSGPGASRPSSNHGGTSVTPSDSAGGSRGATAAPGGGAGTGGNSGGSSTGGSGTKGRIGFQGMTDTNDGLMRMSIE